MSDQPPSESTILSRVLLIPSSLPTIVPLQTFKELFPPSQRSSPRIPLLYRSLRHQRGLDLDLVRENIAAEVARGNGQLRELTHMRAADVTNAGVESTKRDFTDHAYIELPNATSYRHQNAGQSQRASMLPGEEGGRPKTQTTASVIPALEAAVKDLEAEITEIDEEMEVREHEIECIVGGLSDLRYGKLNREEGMDALDILKELDRELDRTLDAKSEIV